MYSKKILFEVQEFTFSTVNRLTIIGRQGCFCSKKIKF